MTISIWKVVDRHELLRAVRVLCVRPSGGLLFVVGDDDVDRGVAADLVADFMESIGMNPVRVLQEAGRATIVKQLLSNAWQQLDGAASALEVPRSVGMARYMPGIEIVREIGAYCASADHPRRPFIFDTVDPHNGVPRPEMGLFVELAEQTASSVVVFSRRESASSVPRAAEVVELGDMAVWEVRTSLATSPHFDGLAASDRDALIEEVLALASGDWIKSVDAYDALEAGLRRITPR